MQHDEAAERFRATVELHETGLALMRQNLRRSNPEAGPAEIDRLLRAWLEARPPDTPGTAWPLSG